MREKREAIIQLSKIAAATLLTLFASTPLNKAHADAAGGFSALGGAMEKLGEALQRQELEKEPLEQEHQQELQQIQLQHNLEMQRIREQQRYQVEQEQARAERLKMEKDQRLRLADAPRSNATKKKDSFTSQMAHLNKTYPDWPQIVGQVDTSKQTPNPNNLFRKWLATKTIAYQNLINGTNNPRQIENSIDLFKYQSARD